MSSMKNNDDNNNMNNSLFDERNGMEQNSVSDGKNASSTTTSTKGTRDDKTMKPKTATKRQIGGAAAVGGIVGLVVAGPVIAIAAGIGVAVAATTKGTLGDVARASGDVVVSAGERLKQLDQKHGVSEKTSKVFVKGCKTVSRTLKPKETDSTVAKPGSAKA